MLLATQKKPGALRTIGEVSDALGIRQHVLRYWETQFPMLRPVKRSGSRRYYRPEDIALLERINSLVHGEGYTLKGACQFLEQQGGTGRSGAEQVVRESDSLESDESLHDSLKKIRETLSSALGRG